MQLAFLFVSLVVLVMSPGLTQGSRRRTFLFIQMNQATHKQLNVWPLASQAKLVLETESYNSRFGDFPVPFPLPSALPTTMCFLKKANRFWLFFMLNGMTKLFLLIPTFKVSDRAHFRLLHSYYIKKAFNMWKQPFL